MDDMFTAEARFRPASPGEAQDPPRGRQKWKGWGGIPANKPENPEARVAREVRP